MGAGQSQKEDAKIKHTGVCKKLHDHYYPDIKFTGDTRLLIGSYGKHTHIRPARDIDVIFMMPPEKYEQYDDNKSNGQAQLLQKIKQILEEKYPDTPIKAYGKVVVLQFADTKHDVELLPAWENEDGTFIIPNSEDGGSWEQWDPRSGIQNINESDSKTGKTRSLIRMVKKWSENCTANLKSYQIENKALDFFGRDDHSEKEYPELVRDLFEYFHETTSDENLKSHISTALNRSQKACDLEKDGKNNDAISEWRKVFGDDFPATSEIKTKAYADAIEPLSDYSHCEGLKWPFSGRCSVSLNAYIYDGTKTTKFGGINSDGRQLSEGLQIKFIANTNAGGNYQYFWQVVNTGKAARLANDLRGNLFSGNQIQWEHCKYRGKHWVECVIVQNDLCIARSGKFFVNIK